MASSTIWTDASLALGNLTNAFGQALSVAALVMVASAPLQAARSAPTLLLTGVLMAAFLSHTSTFAVLSVACLTTVILYWRYGGQALRPSTRALTLSVPRLVHRIELVHGDPGEGAFLAATLTGQRPPL